MSLVRPSPPRCGESLRRTVIGCRGLYDEAISGLPDPVPVGLIDPMPACCTTTIVVRPPSNPPLVATAGLRP